MVEKRATSVRENRVTQHEAARMLQRIVTIQIEQLNCSKRIAGTGQGQRECFKRMAPIRPFELKCPAARSFGASRAHRVVESRGCMALEAFELDLSNGDDTFGAFELLWTNGDDTFGAFRMPPRENGEPARGW